MPLNTTQQDTIRAAISHFFYDLSEDSVTHIQQALECKLPRENSFFELQECFHFPSNQLKRLETMGNSDITLGEVREFMVTVVQESLPTTKVIMTPDIQEKISDQTIFKTSVPDDNDIYRVDLTLNLPSDSTYQARLVIGDVAKAVVSVALPDFPPVTQEIFLANQLPFVNAIEEFKKEAIRQIKKKAAQMLWNLLAASQHLEILFEVPKEDSGIILLTQQYYLNIVKDNRHVLAELKKLSPNTVSNLQDSSIIAALQAEVCKFNDIAYISLTAIRLIKTPFYLAQLLEQKISFKHIMRVTQRQGRMLMHPSIIYLQNKSKISFAQAKIITPEELGVISQEFYLRMMVNGNLRLRDIKKIDSKQQEKLLNPGIIELISAEILFPEEVMKLSVRRCEILTGIHIKKFLLERKIELKEVSYISSSDAGRIEEYPETAWSHFLGRRLRVIFEKNGQSDDSVVQINQDLLNIAQRENLAVETLLSDTIKNYLLFLKRHFSCMYTIDNVPVNYKNIFQVITRAELNEMTEPHNWCATFLEVLQLMRVEVDQASSSGNKRKLSHPAFFKSHNASDSSEMLGLLMTVAPEELTAEKRQRLS